MKLPWSVVAALLAALTSGTLARTTVADPPVPHGAGLSSKKDHTTGPDPLPDLLATAERRGDEVLATLVQMHTGEGVVLDEHGPTQARFEALLADRVTGSVHPLDPRLLELLRTLAAKFPGARIELVSGYRSPKLNEMLRKKGHHVASHSQHSLGHACDFRIIPREALDEEGTTPRSSPPRGIHPAKLRKQIRALGWTGGIGIYPTRTDWFVHADVGRKREWVN